MKVSIDTTTELEKETRKYIMSCLLWHAFEEYQESYTKMTDDIINNYTIEDIEGGIMAWKWLNDETISFLPLKDFEEERGSWVFKLLAAMTSVPKREGAKYVRIDTANKEARDVLISKGFTGVKEVIEEPRKYWELLKEVS